MIEQLEKYRESNDLSKKELAKQLDISLREYNKILKTPKVPISEELKNKIEVLLSSKTEEKTSNFDNSPSTIDIPEYQKKLTRTFDNLTGFPHQDILKAIYKTSNPYKSSLNTVMASTNYINRILPKFDAWSNKEVNTSNNHFTNSIAYISATDRSINNNILKLTNQTLFPIQSSWFFEEIGTLKKSVESLNAVSFAMNQSVKMTDFVNSHVFLTIAESVTKNRELYSDYLNFNSELSKIIYPIAGFNSKLFKENLYNTKDTLNNLDILSGSTFLGYEDYENFDDETDILEKINNDPILKEEANEIFEDVTKILNNYTSSKEDYDFSLLESAYLKLSLWISEKFEKKYEQAQIIAKTFIGNSKLLLLILNIAVINNNISSHNKTQTNQEKIIEEQSEAKKRDVEEKIRDERVIKSQELIIKNQEKLSDKLDKIELDLITNRKIILRKSRKDKSKIVGSVQKGQVVKVLEKKIKWIKITSQESKTSIPITGWVKINDFNKIQ